MKYEMQQEALETRKVNSEGESKEQRAEMARGPAEPNDN